MSGTEKKTVAVIGAGWAGCAAAVELADAGMAVSLFDASHVPGGRARRITIDGKSLDNGQHILLGAYKKSFSMMKKVGVNLHTAFLRLPLQIRYPPQTKNLSFVTAGLPAPLHLVWALFRANGLKTADRIALVRFMSTARWMGWKLNEDCPVTTLLKRLGQTARLYSLLWRPLCVAALNTPPEQASAQIFLNILHDSIGKGRKASDMLIPKQDLSSLFPEKAVAFVRQRGGVFIGGNTIRSLNQTECGWRVAGQPFDAVVIATPAPAAAALLKRQKETTLFDSLDFEPIHTCYFGYSPAIRLPFPFSALKEDATLEHRGQFVFDRGWLNPEWEGILAVVISASSSLEGITRKDLETTTARQLSAVFHQPLLASPQWSRTISERQATFACRPALIRPNTSSGIPGLVFAGDYLHSGYPGTLESAVRSGIQAASCLLAGLA
ncbi:MAG: hydroxysqualene dehydroxylase HpnE [Oxalobacter formigenes]|nr:hydroxysqualene dehydroxylase HpnE [Oxalobacter formigenes]